MHGKTAQYIQNRNNNNNNMKTIKVRGCVKMESGKVIKHCPFVSILHKGFYICTIDGKPLYSTIPLDPPGICPLRDGGITVEIDQAASS